MPLPVSPANSPGPDSKDFKHTEPITPQSSTAPPSTLPTPHSPAVTATGNTAAETGSTAGGGGGGSSTPSSSSSSVSGGSSISSPGGAYSATTNVVRAVMEMTRGVQAAKAEMYVDLVRVSCSSVR